MTALAACLSSVRMDWRTPRDLFDALDAEFFFRVDAAATRENAMVGRYYGPDHEIPAHRDALALAVWNSPAWLNPPYGRALPLWMRHAHAQAEIHGSTVVCLVPARTDSRWWHDYVMQATDIRLIPGRVRFEGATAGAPFPSAIVVFAPRRQAWPNVRAWHWRDAA